MSSSTPTTRTAPSSSSSLSPSTITTIPTTTPTAAVSAQPPPPTTTTTPPPTVTTPTKPSPITTQQQPPSITTTQQPAPITTTATAATTTATAATTTATPATTATTATTTTTTTTATQAHAHAHATTTTQPPPTTTAVAPSHSSSNLTAVDTNHDRATKQEQLEHNVDDENNNVVKKPDTALNVQRELMQEVVYKGSIMHRVLERIGKLNRKDNDNVKKRTHHFRIEDEAEVYGTNDVEVKKETSTSASTSASTGKLKSVRRLKRIPLATPVAHRRLISVWPTVFPQDAVTTTKPIDNLQQNRRHVRVIDGPYKGESGKIVQVIDGRYCLLEIVGGGSYITVNNFHLEPILTSAENDRSIRRRTTNVTMATSPLKVGHTNKDGSNNKDGHIISPSQVQNRTKKDKIKTVTSTETSSSS